MRGRERSIEGACMRAAYYETNGAAREVLRVGEVETPQPGRGEVRVRLAVSGVNPSDVKSRAGLTRKIAFPRVIPHSDGAGEIEQVGEGVSPSRVGERVWVWNGQWRRPFGTAAASIVLPSEQAVPLPANIGMEAAACLGIPAYTAYQAVLLTGIADGSTVLIAAGAGAVGHYAIQFAKKRKATVITTVSAPARPPRSRACSKAASSSTTWRRASSSATSWRRMKRSSPARRWATSWSGSLSARGCILPSP